MLLLIIALVLLGVLLLIAELVLLPGLSIAGICALGSYFGASYLAFTRFGTTVGIVVIISIIILSVVATVVSLKSRTWHKFALNDEIKGTSQIKPETEGVKKGDVGVTVTRLAPMGKVRIGAHIFEAKSYDVFVDQSVDVEVVDFDNFNVIVRKLH